MRVIGCLFFLSLAACAPKEHGEFTHQQFWDNEVHRGHQMDSAQRHDAGHDFECSANGYRLDHCNQDHGSPDHHEEK